MSRLRPMVAALTRGAALEILELHLWPRTAGGPTVDLAIARAAPRRGPALVDLGLLLDDGAPWAGAARAESPSPIAVELAAGALHAELVPLTAPQPRGRAHANASVPGASVDLDLFSLVRHRGLLLGAASGRLQALGRSLTLEDSLVLVLQRRVARRPYAWARAALRGTLDGLPLVCLLETARRRAGSVVLPELGRLRIFGPGAARLPRACVLAPLPLRAEYGTGRLRAAALAPGVRLEIELAAPPDRTGLFEVLDPGGEAAYAHRALGATGQLVVRAREADDVEVALDGRYEWGARAGDPRVALRAWRD